MNFFKLAFTATLMCMLTVPVAAQNKGVDLLKKMEVQFQNLQSVAGTFQQSRIDPTFQTKTTIPARFWVLKPSYFRAEFQSAQGQKPEVQLISNQTFYNYVPQLNQVSTYKFRGESNVRDLNYLLLGFGAKTDEVLKVYKVDPLDSGTGVRLTPRSTQDTSFQYIIMEVDPQTSYPTRFTMRQTDGIDLTVELDLQSLQVNPSLSPKDFEPNFGRGVHQVSLQ